MHQSKLNHINFRNKTAKNKPINFLLSVPPGKKKSFNLENRIRKHYFINLPINTVTIE